MERLITFREALLWARDREIVEETAETDRVVIRFGDGSVLEVASEYEEDYSPDTPGSGYSPPTCFLTEPPATRT